MYIMDTLSEYISDEEVVSQVSDNIISLASTAQQKIATGHDPRKIFADLKNGIIKAHTSGACLKLLSEKAHQPADESVFFWIVSILTLGLGDAILCLGEAGTQQG